MTQENNPLVNALVEQEAASQALNEQLFGGEDTMNEQQASFAAQAMAARMAAQNKTGEVFEHNGTLHYDDEQVKCFKELMTIADVRKLTEGFGGVNASKQNAIMASLAKHGDLVFIDTRTALDKRMDKAEARVQQQFHSENLDYQESQIHARKLDEERQFGLSQKFSLDFFANETQLYNFMHWAQSPEVQLQIVSTGVNANNCPNCIVENVTESQMKQIKRYVREHKLGLTTKKAVKIVEKTLSKSTQFAIEGIVSPVAKSTLAFSGAVIGSTVKATSDIGLQVVNSAVDESQVLARKWNQDPDTQRALSRLSNGFGRVKSKFGSSSAAMNGINPL